MIGTAITLGPGRTTSGFILPLGKPRRGVRWRAASRAPPSWLANLVEVVIARCRAADRRDPARSTTARRRPPRSR
ncbi:hypothetical protein ACU686_22330 [Yinghuangia aomiensis]